VCSIFGAIGPWSQPRLERLARNAGDRGRDGGRMETFGDPVAAVLGNWRATPTPEVERAPFQPYDGLVHNGTIANDVELGARPGEVDSMALARHVDRTDVVALARSLASVRGSYALACWTGSTVLAAVNYKPLHYAMVDGAIYFSSMARHFEGVLPWGLAPVAVPPYTAIDFLTGETAPIQRTEATRTVVIASAGLDSTVVAAKLKAEGHDIRLLHFRYGCQAEDRECERVAAIAARLGVGATFVDLPLRSFGASTLFASASAVVDGIGGAEYAYEWVPARNLVFISVAMAWAEANGYHAVALGNNLEEAGAYPDNEEQFTTHLDAAAAYAVREGYAMRVLAPVGNLMKHEIVALGLALGAPLDATWSCYRGGDVHCGTCGPCFMRRTAFARGGSVDPVMAVA
jgi:7-cyano-7-deazaguanine synthase